MLQYFRSNLSRHFYIVCHGDVSFIAFLGWLFYLILCFILLVMLSQDVFYCIAVHTNIIARLLHYLFIVHNIMVHSDRACACIVAMRAGLIFGKQKHH